MKAGQYRFFDKQMIGYQPFSAISNDIFKLVPVGTSIININIPDSAKSYWYVKLFTDMDGKGNYPFNHGFSKLRVADNPEDLELLPEMKAQMLLIG